MADLLATLDEQYTRHLDMLAAAIETVGDEVWARGEAPLVPAGLLQHALISADFYVSADEADWGARLATRPDFVRRETARRATRAEAAAYLAELRETWRAWLAEQDEASLLGENGFPWTGPNPLARMIYTMRHTYEHIGEINALLRQWDRPRVEWR